MGGLGVGRAYLVAAVLSACLLLVTPITLLVVFLSGDSCCGEDTTGTMAAVTFVIVSGLVALGGGLALVLRDPVGRPTYRALVGWAIIAGPVALVHVAFLAVVSVAAF